MEASPPCPPFLASRCSPGLAVPLLFWPSCGASRAGELKEERESGETFNVCDTQLTEGLKGVSAEMMKDIVIAYEPVWAIGTGLTATPEVAQETHAYIRSWFVENYSQEVADAVVIQYGGSVNDNNVDDLMACADIDGALVGGASLKADSFGRIVNYVKK